MEKRNIALRMLRQCVEEYSAAQKVIEKIEKDDTLSSDFFEKVISTIKKIYDQRRTVFKQYESIEYSKIIKKQLDELEQENIRKTLEYNNILDQLAIA